MIRFILRRLLSTALVLLVVTFVLSLLLNVALDFFWDLRSSTSPNIEALYESRRRLLDLDTPAIVRYFKWLAGVGGCAIGQRSEEHTSELQSRGHLVCRLLLEKKKLNQAR